jgi:hypothetical protein
MNPTLIVVLLIIVGIAAMFFVPQLFIIRAVGQVIRIFRKQSALNPNSAKTADELKIRQKSFIQKQMTFRDYKLTALGILMNANIILPTENGKLYLSEQALANSSFGKRFKRSGS